jgi:hypothetical protein
VNSSGGNQDEDFEDGGFDSENENSESRSRKKNKSKTIKKDKRIGSKSPSVGLNSSFSNVIKDLFKDNKKSKI